MSVSQAKSETTGLIRLTIITIPIHHRKAGCDAAESVLLQEPGKSAPHPLSQTRTARGLRERGTERLLGLTSLFIFLLAFRASLEIIETSLGSAAPQRERLLMGWCFPLH